MKKAQIVFAEVSTRKPLEMSEVDLKQRRKSVWDKQKQPLSGEPTCDAYVPSHFCFDCARCCLSTKGSHVCVLIFG
jgi:hypothetical protein